MHEALGARLSAIKAWRQREFDAGRPSGLKDYYRAESLGMAKAIQKLPSRKARSSR